MNLGGAWKNEKVIKMDMNIHNVMMVRVQLMGDRCGIDIHHVGNFSLTS